MSKFNFSYGLLMALITGGCTPSKTEENSLIYLRNPELGSSMSQLISIPREGYQQNELAMAMATQFPSEWQKSENGEITLKVLVSLSPGQQKAVSLSPNGMVADDLTYTELSVRTGGQWQGKDYIADGFEFENVKEFTSPPQLTDHSYYLRYEGPGWENDLIAYRLYFDWRNGIDVFVKTGPELVLPKVGQDGYESYHHLADWGADSLKVGKALGLGSLGRMLDGNVMHFQHVEATSWKLLSDNNLSSSFAVNYSGWDVGGEKLDVSTDYEIHAGDPSTVVTVKLSQEVGNLVTGLVKHPNTQFISKKLGNWGVIASFGKQSTIDQDDELGLAVFYQLDSVERLLTSEYDHLIQFKPSFELKYVFLSVWPKRQGSPKDLKEFEALLEDKLKALEHPIVIEVK